MKDLLRGAFVTVAAALLILVASSEAVADTGSAGWLGNPVCLLSKLLTYGTISADDGGFSALPGCSYS
ncbi:hypothetical protein AB0H71_17540 [Nocardia sp. NPDC050697]|uniref:hypothetical protein n=1 Tax=Nocardia sp. NPDC050697 TaxID=3155158 RepID=UPI0033CF4019